MLCCRDSTKKTAKSVDPVEDSLSKRFAQLSDIFPGVQKFFVLNDQEAVVFVLFFFFFFFLLLIVVGILD